MVTPIYDPMRAPLTIGTPDTSEEILARWDAFDLLTDNQRNALISDKMITKIEELCTVLDLNETDSALVAHTVRYAYFGEPTHDSVMHYLTDNLSQQGREHASVIADAVMTVFVPLRVTAEEISDAQKPLEVPENPETHQQERSTLVEALAHNPNIIHQQLTTVDLPAPLTGEPMAPTIGNWITIYRSALGTHPHSALERGNFLFHHATTAHLSGEERARLGELLKSLDDATPLAIDHVRQEIIFSEAPSHKEQRSAPASTSAASPFSSVTAVAKEETVVPRSHDMPSTTPQSLAGTVSFSSKQVLPTEIESTDGQKPYHATQIPTLPPSSFLVSPHVPETSPDTISEDVSFNRTPPTTLKSTPAVASLSSTLPQQKSQPQESHHVSPAQRVIRGNIVDLKALAGNTAHK